MEVNLADTSFVNIFEKFNFQDSLAKSVGAYRYEYILPNETKAFKLRFGIPNKASYLKLIYSYWYFEEYKKIFRESIIKIH
jgi:hypothetical protein